MPYAPHAYTVLRGSLGGAATGADMWQFGVRWAFTGTAGGQELSIASVQAVDTAWRTAFGNMAFSTAVKYEEVRGYVIGADGKSISPTPRTVVGTPLAGSTGTSLHPWSVAMAITLDAEGARKGRFGRCYLPPQSLAVDNTGRISGATAGTFADSFKTFLNAVKVDTAAGEALVPVVASRVTGSLRPVKVVRCGDVPDTQRRRDNRLKETYRLSTMP